MFKKCQREYENCRDYNKKLIGKGFTDDAYPISACREKFNKCRNEKAIDLVIFVFFLLGIIITVLAILFLLYTASPLVLAGVLTVIGFLCLYAFGVSRIEPQEEENNVA